MSQQSVPSIKSLREAFERGVNISHLLKNKNPNINKAEIIEIAYDIQAGSYTEIVKKNMSMHKAYAQEIYLMCKEYIDPTYVLLDCGAGELTTTSILSQFIPKTCKIMACDISMSRLRVGKSFASQYMMKEHLQNMDLFVADMANLPVKNNSVDVVFTSHALEPNHGREDELIKELMRIARRYLLLFEPSWENASDEARKRMQKHGYIRELPKFIINNGGRLIKTERLPNPPNPDNPTYCHIVDVQESSNGILDKFNYFQCPRSGHILQNRQNYLWSHDGGWAYPIIDDIACLRNNHGILMSHD